MTASWLTGARVNAACATSSFTRTSCCAPGSNRQAEGERLQNCPVKETHVTNQPPPHPTAPPPQEAGQLQVLLVPASDPAQASLGGGAAFARPSLARHSIQDVPPSATAEATQSCRFTQKGEKKGFLFLRRAKPGNVVCAEGVAEPGGSQQEEAGADGADAADTLPPLPTGAAQQHRRGTRTHTHTHTMSDRERLLSPQTRLLLFSSLFDLEEWRAAIHRLTTDGRSVGASAGDVKTSSRTFSDAHVLMQTFPFGEISPFSDPSSPFPDINVVPPDLLTLTCSCGKLRMTQQPPLRSSNAGIATVPWS